MTDAPGIRIPCQRCGHTIPEDPKAPGQPGMHFCAPPDDDLDFDRLTTTYNSADRSAAGDGGWSTTIVPPPQIEMFRAPLNADEDMVILPRGATVKISMRKPDGEIEYTILTPGDPDAPLILTPDDPEVPP